MKIAFKLDNLDYRGTQVAQFNYAKYNRELLNNESIIIVHDWEPNLAKKKFEEEFARNMKI